MLPPTRITLAEVGAEPSVDALMAAAGRRDARAAIMPKLVD
jgi:hypothetical protein